MKTYHVHPEDSHPHSLRWFSLESGAPLAAVLEELKEVTPVGDWSLWDEDLCWYCRCLGAPKRLMPPKSVERRCVRLASFQIGDTR